MSHYIPKLARISSGKGAAGKRKVPHDSGASGTAVNVARLTRLVPQVRRRLGVGRQFSDEALLASLSAIARHPTHAERWRAAESSTLGQYLAGSGKDMHRTLVTLLSMLPPPTP
jgi:hypothetical protein